MYVNKINKYGLARAAGLLLYEYNMASGCYISHSFTTTNFHRKWMPFLSAYMPLLAFAMPLSQITYCMMPMATLLEII